MTPRDALSQAIAAAGGQQALADALGVRQSLVWYWLHKAKGGAAPEHVRAIERHTGIPAHALRPDLWSAPQPEAMAS